ncbi:hypothetical protein [Haliangium sp.]|uniref:hypothetical protein n=1 Tax=Haliangium sp. TaxID=2663208 RepID=UPI003D0AFC31
MKHLLAILFTGSVLVWSAAPAQAEKGFGVGAQAMLTGPGVLGRPGFAGSEIAGLSGTYDAGAFHIDAIFGLAAGDNTRFGMGAQFWYILHGGGIADFSVGGGLGVADDGDDDTDFHVNAGIKIRLFLVSNVALSTIAGMGFILDDDDDAVDDDDIVLGGQTVGIMGVTYFFE